MENTRLGMANRLPAVELQRLNRETEAIFLLGNFRIGKNQYWQVSLFIKSASKIR